MRPAKLGLTLSLSLVFFLLDRLVKNLFLVNPEFQRDFIIGFLGLRLETNSGIAFGWLAGNQWWLAGLIILVLIILLYATRFLWQSDQVLPRLGLGLIVAGAISNLVDRWRYGFVIDYIDVPFFTVFNLADIMITLGVVLLFWFNLFGQLAKKAKMV